MSDTQRLNIPVPDPSVLTTEQLRRELGALREVIETRLNAMDRAASLFHEDVNRVPSDLDRQVAHIREVVFEKFTSVDRRFAERDERYTGYRVNAEVAVSAALQAQKDATSEHNRSNDAAIAKSEIAAAKQMDGLKDMLETLRATMNDKVLVLTSRLDRGEGQAKGISSSVAMLIAVLSLGAALIAAVSVLIPHSSAAPPERYVVTAPGGVSVSPQR